MPQPFAIAIHGGAGTILKHQMSEELKLFILEDLKKSVLAGHSILKMGGNSLNAVVEAVKVLEDSSNFNAGKGSVLTNKATVEMDASVMCGKAMTAGAVAGVRHIKNPVMLAKDVMQNSDHVLLIGEGAEEFAFENNYKYTEEEYFHTERRHKQLQYLKEKGLFTFSECEYPDDNKYGTVGAVALDQNGNLAAATSTGGVANKKYGRVGDSALIGSGTVAENGNVAVSATGMGEIFIRKMVAGDVAARMRYLGEDVHTASKTIIQGDLKTIGGEGGLIAIDAFGDICFAMNSSGMYRASIDVKGDLNVKVYADD
ncbi:isoaspartyl peptidase [Candidatus Photodesmus blepharus]|uniref:Isoaspartyl peptidase n=1 Tax=Candidatus Photodesmus blepharonis TaxID=1179155 RepID=A0A084CN97_9GAMM|nr:isoaspartyl peptidase/L-asparaginase [Candidatus Photodesmus blepharus]KEY91276.1 isoaspartyl peptidase [Candidatus Photodesmus blepharus]